MCHIFFFSICVLSFLISESLCRCLLGMKIWRRQFWLCFLSPRWPSTFALTHRPGLAMAPFASALKCWVAQCQVQHYTTVLWNIWVKTLFGVTLYGWETAFKQFDNLSVCVDPDSLQFSETESGSTDDLDFRHHNYNEMRKVRVILDLHILPAYSCKRTNTSHSPSS